MLDETALFHELDPALLRRRRGMKWSRCPPGVLPSWVADMDFPVAPVIRQALREAVDLSDFGYPPDDLANGLPQAFAARARRLWDWDLDPGRVYALPDVVRGIALCVEHFTRPGDPVMVVTPAYPPLLNVVRRGARQLVELPLGADARLDPALATDMVASRRPRLVLFCNPHNPTGRLFCETELRAVAEAAADQGSVLVSDEIHAEVVFEGRHTPLATLSDAVGARTVTLTSASKAFNIAGLRCAVMAVGGAPVLAPLAEAVGSMREPVGALGVLATLAAWTPEGDEWLSACLRVLAGNRRLIAARLTSAQAGIDSGIKYAQPQATYFAWLDCRSLGLSIDPAAWFLREAKVALSSGLNFGPAGQGFVRLNFATSPAILQAILNRMLDAICRQGLRTSTACA